AVLGYLRLDDVVPVPEVRGIAVPTWLLVGGVIAGLLASLIARLVNGAAASRRARRAEKSLHAAVSEVAQELVVGPVESELDVHNGEVRWVVDVRALAEKRGPASVAATLYEEHPESVESRRVHALERRLSRPLGADLGPRPTKQDRRRIEALRRAQRRPGRP